MKKTVAWEASDGSVWPSEKDCRKQEILLVVKRVIGPRNVEVKPDAYFHSFVSAVANNYDAIIAEVEKATRIVP
jgi:hypothetical protein